MLIKGCLIVIFFLCEQSLQIPLSPPTTSDLKSEQIDAVLLPPPLVITKPNEKEDISSFLSIWEHRFSTQSDVTFSSQNEGSKNVPKMILAVTYFKMTNLIPQDAPHPLYSSHYEKLTDDFILDSLSTQTIDFNDNRLTSSEGLKVRTMGGKELVFKKDPISNKFSVNGVEIEKHYTNSGNTNVIILSDFLFNYYNDIRVAFDELINSSQRETSEINPGINPGFRSEVLETVQIPDSLKHPNSAALPSAFVRIWENRLSTLAESQDTNLRTQNTVPKLVLTPSSSQFTNLVPQDAPHPLYSSEFENLTDDFILGSLSTQTIDFNDIRLTSPEGITIKTMNGKDLLFRKDQRTGVLTVNGILIVKHQELDDGTTVVSLNNFLFNIFDEVQKAFRELSRSVGPETRHPLFGEHVPPPPGFESPNPPSDSSALSVPEIPESFSMAFEGDKFLNLWKFRLSKLKEPSISIIDSRVPQIILPVSYFKMVNLIPQDAGNPLYTNAYQNLAHNFILDSLSTDKLDCEDPNWLLPEGVTIKTMNGKDLVIKKDANTGKISVNGINVESCKILSDQKIALVLGDFLFNYYEDVQKAFREYQNRPDTPTFASPILENSPETPLETESHTELESATQTEIKSTSQTDLESSVNTRSVPEIPQDLEAGEEASNFVFIWKNRLSDFKMGPGVTRTETALKPKTVLAVDYFKMLNLIPQDAPHPLLSSNYEDLTDRFILDSLSNDEINFEDPKLLTPEGVTIKTMTGKDLKFTKDQNTGNIQVNGIDVSSHKVLNGNTNLIIIKDFLFTLYDDVQTAFHELDKSSHNIGFGFHGPPNIPAIPALLEAPDVKIDVFGFLRIWQHQFSDFGLTSDSNFSTENAPKTIIAVSSIKITNLTPQDAPNPLYSTEYEHLTNAFILDSLSAETVNTNDPNLLTNGVTIRNLSGKDLEFKKDEQTNKLTINGINVEDSKTFEDGTTVFIISDFLFNHYNDVQTAFDSLLRESPNSGHRPF